MFAFLIPKIALHLQICHSLLQNFLIKLIPVVLFM